MNLSEVLSSELLNMQNKIMPQGNKIKVPLEFKGKQQKGLKVLY